MTEKKLAVEKVSSRRVYKITRDEYNQVMSSCDSCMRYKLVFIASNSNNAQVRACLLAASLGESNENVEHEQFDYIIRSILLLILVKMLKAESIMMTWHLVAIALVSI